MRQIEVAREEKIVSGFEDKFTPLWGTKKLADVEVCASYEPQKGILMKMTCKESNPLTTFTENQDPVYRDSAMEAFFQFPFGKETAYMNLEVNSNGAMLAGYGIGRTDRKRFSEEWMDLVSCASIVEDDQWSVEFTVPIEVLRSIYGIEELKAGMDFGCNFYKISETKEIEHYGAFSPIDSATPNFHRPDCFAKAVLV